MSCDIGLGRSHYFVAWEHRKAGRRNDPSPVQVVKDHLAGFTVVDKPGHLSCFLGAEIGVLSIEKRTGSGSWVITGAIHHFIPCQLTDVSATQSKIDPQREVQPVPVGKERFVRRRGIMSLFQQIIVQLTDVFRVLDGINRLGAGIGLFPACRAPGAVAGAVVGLFILLSQRGLQGLYHRGQLRYLSEQVFSIIAIGHRQHSLKTYLGIKPFPTTPLRLYRSQPGKYIIPILGYVVKYFAYIFSVSS